MPDPRSSLPDHGRIACSKCFPGPTAWNESELRVGDWHVVNNPMSWGTAAPRYLVLGVSKGTTQCAAIAARPHDEVPFHGFRPALSRALQLLGLLDSTETVGDKIAATEREWAFGSMVRCALGLSKADQSIARPGTIVQRLAAMDGDASWIVRCSAKFLGALPDSLRIVVLLSNDDRYVEACFAAIRQLRPATSRINSVSYGDGQITWVHIVHVGGPGKNHVAAWFGGEGSQGDKRRAAQAAVRNALGQTVRRSSIEREPDPKVPGANSRGERLARRSAAPRKPIPLNSVRDAILNAMKVNAFFAQHPPETAADGTKYVSAFLGRNGRAIAFDKAIASSSRSGCETSPDCAGCSTGSEFPSTAIPPKRDGTAI